MIYILYYCTLSKIMQSLFSKSAAAFLRCLFWEKKKTRNEITCNYPHIIVFSVYNFKETEIFAKITLERVHGKLSVAPLTTISREISRWWARDLSFNERFELRLEPWALVKMKNAIIGNLVDKLGIIVK